jgi:serine/threonine-protein kinase
MSDAAAERRLGTTVGKYRLERVLGAGGMATVYEAAHSNGLRVAVKMLRPALSVDEETRARFLREGYAANKVAHPGAVRVLDDVVTDDGHVFLVMELLRGSTLAELGKRAAGGLPPSVVVDAGMQLLDVLAAAHEVGLVHRDVKPENVFAETSGRIKLLDFGVARIALPGTPSSTTTGRMLGSPAFMSPEQAYGRRDEIDERSDLWSVGATLFTLLTGRVVHHATTAEETLIRAATAPAPAIRDVAEDVPDAVAAVIDRALRADKAERWPSAKAMRSALAAAAAEVFGEAPEAGHFLRDALGDSVPFVATLPPRPAPVPKARWMIGALAALGIAVASVAVRTPAPQSEAARTEIVPVEVPIQIPTVVPTLDESASVAQPAAPRVLPRAVRRSPPAPVKSAEPSAATSCGFDYDEDGRRWPRRCP